MKIILVGASGTIGQAVLSELGSRHDIVRVGRSSGDVRVDIRDSDSIRQLFAKVGSFDALVSTAGQIEYGPLQDFTPERFGVGLSDKLMGQVNLVLLGLPHITDRGSFTLTTGLLNECPAPGAISASMVNGGLEGFVRGAAIELPRGVRINAVSPTITTETQASAAEMFRGVQPMPAAGVALGYARSVEGALTGRVFRMGWSRDGQ